MIFQLLSTSVLLIVLNIRATMAGCGKEQTEFLTCVSDYSQTDPNRYPWGMDFNQFQDMISNCLTKHGCKDAKLETPQRVFEEADKYFVECQKRLAAAARLSRARRAIRTATEAPAGPPPTVNLTDYPNRPLLAADRQRLVGCKRSVRRALRAETERCARGVLGDQQFSLPAENTEKIAEIPLDFILIDEHYSTAVFNLTKNKDVCPDQTTPKMQRKLRQCLGTVFNAARDQPGLNVFEKRARLFGLKTCNANCLAKLNECKDEEKTVAICKCVPEEKKPFYRNMLRDCYPELDQANILDSVLARDFNIVRSQICIMHIDRPCA